jgi:hypothetical protein
LLHASSLLDVFLIVTQNMLAAVKLKCIFNENEVKSYASTMFKRYFDVENDDSKESKGMFGSVS